MEYSEIGIWSEAKLDIVRKYAKSYSTILSKQEKLSHVYIDAFAGPGLHRAKISGRFVTGSPLNALSVEPPFAEYHFIDLDNERVRALEDFAADHGSVQLYHGDANSVLIEDIYPNLSYTSYRRALCLLDPYGLQLNWEVIKGAGGLGTVEIFLNFPIHDMNRNVLIRDPSKMDPRQVQRMDDFWTVWPRRSASVCSKPLVSPTSPGQSTCATRTGPAFTTCSSRHRGPSRRT